MKFTNFSALSIRSPFHVLVERVRTGVSRSNLRSEGRVFGPARSNGKSMGEELIRGRYRKLRRTIFRSNFSDNDASAVNHLETRELLFSSFDSRDRFSRKLIASVRLECGVLAPATPSRSPESFPFPAGRRHRKFSATGLVQRPISKIYAKSNQVIASSQNKSWHQSLLWKWLGLACPIREGRKILILVEGEARNKLAH